MKKHLYSIWDRKSNMYAAPFMEQTDGTAIRAIQDLIQNNANHQFARYAEDFALVSVGQFDEATGELHSEQKVIIELEQLTTKDE